MTNRELEKISGWLIESLTTSLDKIKEKYDRINENYLNDLPKVEGIKLRAISEEGRKNGLADAFNIISDEMKKVKSKIEVLEQLSKNKDYEEDTKRCQY